VVSGGSHPATCRKAAIAVVDFLRFCRLLASIKKLHGIVLPSKSSTSCVSIVTVEWIPDQVLFRVTMANHTQADAAAAISKALRENLETLAPILNEKWMEMADNIQLKSELLLPLYQEDLMALGLPGHAQQVPSNGSVLVSGVVPLDCLSLSSHLSAVLLCVF
jgi:hypothetical protein